MIRDEEVAAIVISDRYIMDRSSKSRAVPTQMLSVGVS